MEGHLFVYTANRCHFYSSFKKKTEVETLVNVLRIHYSWETKENNDLIIFGKCVN